MNCFHRTFIRPALALTALVSAFAGACTTDIDLGLDNPDTTGGSGGATSGDTTTPCSCGSTPGDTTSGAGGSFENTTGAGGGILVTTTGAGGAPPGETTTGVGGAGGAGSGGGTPLSEFPPAECGAPDGPALLTTSEMQFVGVLSRVWARCSEDILWTQHDGIEFTSDGLWYLLRYENGLLARANGFDTVGSWTILDPSFVGGVYVPGKVEFDIFGAGSTDMEPAFIDNPLKLNLMGVGSELVYVAVQ